MASNVCFRDCLTDRPTPYLGRRLPLAIWVKERLLVAVVHSKAAVPVSARSCHQMNVRILVSPSQSRPSQIHPQLGRWSRPDGYTTDNPDFPLI